ncbi:hypothetical protein O0L34_g9870 [Tuta absoluta]|nr:hypothetical protein O0L34_g9870 [Tuta absoluta]
MSVVLRRTCLKAKNNAFSAGNGGGTPLSSCFTSLFSRAFSEDKTSHPEFINSTILMENGLNVHELPVVVRKLTDISDITDKPASSESRNQQDTVNYHLIKAEFKQCIDLRDVFSLLSKCTKITPNIALGAMERIYDLEQNITGPQMVIDANNHINMAKGAIVDKLVRVVTKTEDTQTILNVLKAVSTFMDPFKPKFCDELLFRAIDNKMSIEQLCEFITFLKSNKEDPKFSETIDKLWVGFVQREAEINPTNIVQVFSVLPALKVSKRTVLSLLEQKFFELWCEIKVPAMLEILNKFLEENYSSMQSFAAVGRWLYTNIHALDEDSLLEVVTKLTRLNYTDVHIEKAVEKYIKLKGSKIKSHILIIGILNYCMQFHIKNEQILNVCCDYYLTNGTAVPPSFLKSFIYPFGYLNFQPKRSEFWDIVEKYLYENFDKITADDMSSMVLSLIYIGKHPTQLVNKLLSPEYLSKVNNPSIHQKLHLIDTALSLECADYNGPLLPKDQWSKPIPHDTRIKNIVHKIMDCLTEVAGGPDKLSTAVSVPYLYSDETYHIDVMLHPKDLGSDTFNWKLKTSKNENTAILIHLPDHYCFDNESLIGPQEMRKRHLKLLGLKVVKVQLHISDITDRVWHRRRLYTTIASVLRH